jgi:hypothetical protein
MSSVETTRDLEDVGKQEEGNAMPEVPESNAPGLRTYFAFAAMCVVVLTESLDATSIAVVLPVSHKTISFRRP